MNARSLVVFPRCMVKRFSSEQKCKMRSLLRSFAVSLVYLVTLFSFVIAPPPTSELLNVAQKASKKTQSSVSNADLDSDLAARFPHIPSTQRTLLGDIPPAIDGLIQGVSPDSKRVLLAAPPSGHALLLTKHVGRGKRVPAYTSLSTPATKSSTTTVRGVGVITNHNGEQYYFRTAPFHLHPSTASISSSKGQKIAFTQPSYNPQIGSC